TIAANTANSQLTNATGGGLYSIDAGVTVLNNTIVAGNSKVGGNPIIPVGIPNDIDAVLDAASSNNLVGDAGSSGGLVNGPNGNIVGVDVRTVLAPLADTGGPTLTFALLPGSPAIHAGNTSKVPDGVTTDQRGLPFARITNGHADIGAEQSGQT